MSLKPSRRLPRAFQRPATPATRRMARKLVRREWRGGWRPDLGRKLTQLMRQWRRLLRSLTLSLRFLRNWCLCAGGLCLLFLVLFFLFSPYFRVIEMRVSREARHVDIEEVQQILLPFFGKHLTFLSTRLLERTVLKALPEVSSVSVRKKFPNEVHLTLFADPIVADVLMGEPDDTEANLSDIQTQEQFMYLTSKGIYLAYPFLLGGKEGEERLTLHLVDWAVRPTHRQALLRTELLKKMQSVRTILEESFGHAVSSVTVYLRAQEFHVQTEALVLWFDSAKPLVQQIEHYRTFLRALPPGSAREYVDLRLHDRVVYR